jgi:hypothetical protein
MNTYPAFFVSFIPNSGLYYRLPLYLTLQICPCSPKGMDGIADGIEIADTTYQVDNRESPRRTVMNTSEQTNIHTPQESAFDSWNSSPTTWNRVITDSAVISPA